VDFVTWRKLRKQDLPFV